MGLEISAYADLKMLSAALTQFVENDMEAQEERAERGESEPEEIMLARGMLDRVDALILIRLNA